MRQQSFLDELRKIEAVALKEDGITIENIFHVLAGKGYAALLILFSIPFCFPITIPGMSFPFGMVLAFCGLRIAFGQKLWWPEWVLRKRVTAKQTSDIVNAIAKSLQRLQKVLHPRMVFLTQNPWLHRLHGVTIFILAVFLSLPIPLPFSNMICALPLLFFGFGFLEDDGVAIVIAYVLSVVCFVAFALLFLFGKSVITQLF